MEETHSITRENHLNHLVRVVPLLALAYGVQSWLMLQWAQGGPTGFLILCLGLSLALSVIGMVFYDQHHRVSFGEDSVTVRAPWLFGQKRFGREDISSIHVEGAEDAFQTVTVKLKNRRTYRFYFTDNGHLFQKTMQGKSNHDFEQAA